MIQLTFHLLSQTDAIIGYSGLALRGAFLNMVKNQNEPLGAWFHSGEGTRPYSLYPFEFDRGFKTRLEGGQEYCFGVTLFETSNFNDTIRDLVVSERDPIKIHRFEFPILRVQVKQLDANFRMSSWIQETMDSKGIRMRFLTPTQLSHFGINRAFLFPTPDKIFSSLLRVWNTMDSTYRKEPISEYRSWVEDNVYVSRHKIRTVRIDFGKNHNILGFIGDVTFSFEEMDSDLADVTRGLARFAEICNVGKNRTAGLGMVEVGM